jgi:hypothetical protein
MHSTVKIFLHHQLVKEYPSNEEFFIDYRDDTLTIGGDIYKKDEWNAVGSGILCGGHVDDDPNECKTCSTKIP